MYISISITKMLYLIFVYDAILRLINSRYECQKQKITISLQLNDLKRVLPLFNSNTPNLVH